MLPFPFSAPISDYFQSFLALRREFFCRYLPQKSIIGGAIELSTKDHTGSVESLGVCCCFAVVSVTFSVVFWVLVHVFVRLVHIVWSLSTIFVVFSGALLMIFDRVDDLKNIFWINSPSSNARDAVCS